jgi:hypothetical protein
VDDRGFEELPKVEPYWLKLDRATACRKRLLAAGYLPLPVNGKEPSIKGWQDIKATITIIDSWETKYADAVSTGILTETVPAIDVDIMDPAAAAAVEALAREHFEERGHILVRFGQVPKRAILLRTDESFKKIVRKFVVPIGGEQRIEILASGQQIVLFGPHKETRRLYTWHGGEPGAVKREELPYVRKGDVEAFLDAATELLIKKFNFELVDNKQQVKAPQKLNGAAGIRERAYAAATLDGCTEELTAATSGSRNELLNKLAFRLGRMIARGWLKRADVEETLLEAMHGNGAVADDGVAAATATLTSGLDAGAKEPHPDLNDHGDGNGDAIDATPEQPTILNYRWHRDANTAAPKYLVKNLLPETGVGLLSGQSGTYKSFIAIKLAGAVGTTQPFAGYPVKRQGAALIFASEGAGELPVRLEALSEAEHGGEVLPIYYCDAGIRLLDPGSVADVIATAKTVAAEAQRDSKLPLALVLFDTVIAAAQFAKAGDENDAAIGAKLMSALAEISRETGAFVLGIDHFGKAVETGTRGTSAKEAAADVVLALLADRTLSGEVTAPRLAVRKRRSGPAGVEHPFTVKSVRLGQDEDGEEVTSLAIEFSTAVPPAANDEAGKWSPSLRLFRKILMTLLATAGEQIQPYADGSTVLAVKTELVRAEFYKQFSSDKTDSKRKAFQRAISGAQSRDLIAIREVNGIEWLWLITGTAK